MKSEGAGTISLSNRFSQESRHSNEKLTKTHAQPWHDERGVPNDSTTFVSGGLLLPSRMPTSFRPRALWVALEGAQGTKGTLACLGMASAGSQDTGRNQET